MCSHESGSIAPLSDRFLSTCYTSKDNFQIIDLSLNIVSHVIIKHTVSKHKATPSGIDTIYEIQF